MVLGVATAFCLIGPPQWTKHRMSATRLLLLLMTLDLLWTTGAFALARAAGGRISWLGVVTYSVFAIWSLLCWVFSTRPVAETQAALVKLLIDEDIESETALRIATRITRTGVRDVPRSVG